MSTHHDLLIVGTGSGNSVPDEDLAEWSVGVVESGVFGGTCLNRGCIPSKMFVYAADVAMHVREAGRFGLDASLHGADWPAIRDRVFGRIDPIAAGGREYRAGLPNTTLYEAEARFVGDRRVEVGSEIITADQVVLAVGSRPVVPDWPGLHDVPHVTSDTVMRLEQRPQRLLVVGGGFIAAEMGHVFDALGSEVTIITRGEVMLSAEDDEVAVEVTRAYRERGIAVHTQAEPESLRFRSTDDGLVADYVWAGGDQQVEADLVLVAVGRTSNADSLDLAAAGIDVDDRGMPVVDPYQRTTAEGVWSLGDVSSQHWLKHVANAEARTVAHNIRHPEDLKETDLPNVPSAVFGHPQVASAGARERDLVAADIPHLVARRDYGGTAYGWAMEDTTSFVKILVDPTSRLLLGVHGVGPNASLVIQPLIQAMALGNTVDEVARGVIYIHPALSEVVENVLLDLPQTQAD